MPTMYSTRSIIKFSTLIILAIFFARPVLALTLTSSETVTISAQVGGSINPLNDNNGSNGSGFMTNVTFSGSAYPNAVVHIWKDGTPKMTTRADAKGSFSITLNEIYSPSALYTLYAIDKDNRQSLLLNYPIVVKTGYVTQVSGIVFAPTISTDKTEVKEGDYLSISGYALPNAYIDLSVEGSQNMTYHLTSKNDGKYNIIIPLINMYKGIYNLHVNYSGDKRISKVVQFTIGEANILSTELTANIPGDCNADQVIDLVDFSVAAFWYGKSSPPRCVDTNSDNAINLVDFSILAFYWTG